MVLLYHNLFKIGNLEKRKHRLHGLNLIKYLNRGVLMYDCEKEYKKQLAIAKEQIESYQEELITLKYSQGFSGQRESAILKKERFLAILEKELEFLRCPTREDIDYRMSIYSSSSSDFVKALEADLPFRFHGTPIYFAREIIQSREISCNQDRFGFQTSHDLSGHISVCTIENVGVSIHNYMSLTDFCMPAGCLFVLLPQQEDGVVKNFQMKKVDFAQNPEVLIAIITTPENIAQVKRWCEESGIDSNKIFDFYSFIKNPSEKVKQYILE